MLKQNTLADATTEQGFPTETNTPLTRKVITEDGEVTVEGITPYKMKEVLNQAGTGTNTFKTPGEIYQNDNIILNGVVQNYNGEQPTPPTPVTPGFTESADIMINEVKYGTVEMTVPDDYDKGEESIEVNFVFTNTSEDDICSEEIDFIESNNSTDYSVYYLPTTREALLSILNDYYANSFIVATSESYSKREDIKFNDITYGFVDAYVSRYKMNLGTGTCIYNVGNTSSSNDLVLDANILDNVENIIIEPGNSYNGEINFDTLTVETLDSTLNDIMNGIHLVEPSEEQPE